MSSYNSSPVDSKSSKTDPSRNWSWLQSQIELKTAPSKSAQLGEWIAAELDSLELTFEHLITVKSRSRFAAQEAKKER